VITVNRRTGLERAMYKRILWAHDRSELADSALPHVVALARAFDSLVIVCSVVEVDEGLVSTETRPAEGIVSNEHLDRAADELRAQGVNRVETLVMQGVAARAVVDTAQMQDVQLIVVSTRARSGVARAIVGSVSDVVSRSTPGIPVLVVHPAEEEEAE